MLEEKEIQAFPPNSYNSVDRLYDMPMSVQLIFSKPVCFIPQ